jgi:transaldolase
MLLVDTASIAELTASLSFPGVSGYTTNPSLITRAAGVTALTVDEYQNAVLSLLRQSNELVADDGQLRQIMIQGFGTAEQLIAMAREWSSQLDAKRWRLWVKLLPESAALAAIPSLSREGLSTLVTAVYTPAQAAVACAAGAEAIAVYVGRLRRSQPDWERQLSAIAGVIREGNRRLLLASFPDLETVNAALMHSNDLTVPPMLLPQLLESPLSAAAIIEFNNRIRTT